MRRTIRFARLMPALFCAVACGQTISTVSPNTGAQGQQLTVTITGRGTHFDATTTASFGAGITVTMLTVNSTTTVSANISIAATAIAGSRDITMTTGMENATLSGGFSITAISSITATAGTPQSAPINTAFPTALRAKVQDSANQPVNNVTVTFTASASGAATGTFPTGASATATTDLNGIATAPAFTANGTQGGPYKVSASVMALVATADFSLTNTAPMPASITVVSGGGQSAQVNTAFTNPLVALVKDGANNPLSGVTVTFTAPTAGQGVATGTFPGGLSTATATTGANGQATSPVFTAGTVAGGFGVTAGVSGVTTPANFLLTNTAGPAANITVVSGSGQSAQINAAFTSPLVAVVKDASGNGVSGVTVTFTAPTAAAGIATGTFAGGLSSTMATTGANGQATSPIFTAGSVAGAYNVTASAPSVGPSAIFALTNTSGGASSITAVSGTGQVAQINTAFTNPLVVIVKDAGGNPVSGATVTFTAPGAGAGVATGTFTGGSNSAQAQTGPTGQATSPVFTAGAVAGAYTVTATTPGASPSASFSLTNTAGGASTVTALSGGGQSAQINAAFTNPLVAVVKDSGGNPVSGVTVTFTAPAPGTSVATATFAGGLSTTSATTDANGQAASPALTAGTVAGPFSVSAIVQGVVTAASFSLTNTAGPASTITVVSGGGQSAQVNATFTNPLIVLVKDISGNPVRGVTVTFASPAAGAGVATGTFAGSATAQVTTAANGQATSALTAGGTAGTYNVTASVQGIATPASFSMTNTAGSPGSILTVSGSGQSAQINAAFSNPLIAIVKDGSGNPVSGVTVTFTATSASGVPSATFAGGGATAQATTGSNGQASSPAFTANTVAGAYTVAASAPGVATPTFFQLTNNAGAAASITPLSGGGQTAQAYFTYANPLVALVRDAGGNPVAGASVTFAVVSTPGSAGGSVSGNPTVVTGSNGQAVSPTVYANGLPGAFNVQATTNGVATPAIFPLTIFVPLVITCPVSTGTVGQNYSSSATASGGQAPYTWSQPTGIMPPGLTLVPQTGLVTGTPTSAATYNLTLLATDRVNATGSMGCKFTITPALAITTAALLDASLSSPYLQNLAATGGRTPYTWTLTSGNLPPGLALNSTGAISGTPTQVGSFVFALTVTDATPISVQRTYTINVVTGLVVGNCPASQAEVGYPYNATLVAQGGSPPYTWTIVGALPPGLQLNTTAGSISGTPTQVAQAAVTINVIDASRRAASKQCAITAQPQVTITTTTLAQGATGVAYSDTVAVSGGWTPLVFSTSAGSLPPGVTLDATSGKFSGRPTSAGSFNFTVLVVDGLGAQATKNLSLTVGQGLVIPNCPPPVGTVGQFYSGSLVAQGGVTPYVWSLGSGTLPSGLGLDSPNAVISGTPGQSGISTFVLQVNDAAQNSVTRSCSIQINAAALTITSNASLPNATIGVAYSQTLSASGGVTPYTWSLANGALPQSFTLDPSGVISGATSTAGTFSFTLQVTDNSGTIARQNVTLTVQAGTAPAVSIGGLSDIVSPASQPAFTLQLAAGYPAPITGTVTLTFVPDPTVGVDDPSIQFSTGGRTLNFTVAANSTTPVFQTQAVSIQTGTVAGTIQFAVKLTSNGLDVTPSTAPARTVRVDRLAPQIVSVRATQSGGGIAVTVIAYSTTRELTQGTFQFAVSGGSPIIVTVPLSSGATTWFQSSGSQQFGGQFALTQPFTLQGSVGALTSVSVTLTNGQGTSAASNTSF